MTYEFGYKTSKGIANVLQISEKPSAESKLGLGDPSTNFSLRIIIRVKDKHGFYAELTFPVQVNMKKIICLVDVRNGENRYFLNK